MNARMKLLGGLLALQLLAVAGLLVADGMGGAGAGTALLPFEASAVVKLGVASQDEELALQRGEDGWQLESGLPADAEKIREALEKLAGAPAAWPVATSDATAERFEVTEENFQRRLAFETEDGEASALYLGTSPGYRRVHARLDGQDEVFSIDFANYEAPTEAEQWLDKTLLQAQGAVSSVQLQGQDGAWRLEREGDDGEWLLDGAAADQEAADKLANRFVDLRVIGFAEEPAGAAADAADAPAEVAAQADESTENPADAAQGAADSAAAPADAETASPAPKARFTLVDEQGEYRLDLFFDEQEEDYSVVSSRVDGRFEVASYIAEQMLAKAEDLLPEEEAPPDPPDSPASAETPPDAIQSAP